MAVDRPLPPQERRAIVQLVLGDVPTLPDRRGGGEDRGSRVAARHRFDQDRAVKDDVLGEQRLVLPDRRMT